MNGKMFDVLLDMDDENFVQDLMNALGVKDGDSIQFTTPQFSRDDGRVVTYIPKTVEEYDALKLMAPENLVKVGCQKWGDEVVA